MTSYLFIISIECPHCRTGIPVNGFGHQVKCSGCLKTIELPDAWWKLHMDEEMVREALSHKSGEAGTSNFLSGMSERFAYGNMPARCQECKTPFAPQFLAEAGQQGGGDCPQCKHHVRVRKATPLVLSLIPEAEWLVNEDDMTGDLGKEATHTLTPIVFACMTCGGALKVDGSNRTPKCEHCGNLNYLPDPLWFKLHPAATTHPFFVTRNADATPVVLTVKNFPDAMDAGTALATLKAQNPPDNVLKKMAQHFAKNPEVLSRIAEEPMVGEDTLSFLAMPNQPEPVRIALAKRQHLAAKVAEILSRDPSPEVRKALINTKSFLLQPRNIVEPLLKGLRFEELEPHISDGSLPAWKLKQMASNASTEQANVILSSPQMTEEILKLLGKQPANRDAIRKHPLYTKKGFLGRMFFFS